MTILISQNEIPTSSHCFDIIKLIQAESHYKFKTHT